MPDEAQPGAEAPQAAPEVAPAEGQGTEGQDQGLYSEILDGIPPEYHQTLTEKLKAKDGDFTKRFQSVSEQWSPYEELGVQNYDPNQLGEWLGVGQAFAAAAEGDEEALEATKEWIGQMAEAYQVYDEGGEGEGATDAEDLLDLSPQQLQEMVGSQVAEQVTPLIEHLQQQEQQALQQEAETQVQDQIRQLRTENPNLTDDDERRILSFAYVLGQDSEDPIAAGFEEFKATLAQGENSLLEQKLSQPSPAEPAGRADSSYTPPGTFEEAERAARSRFEHRP